VMIDEELLQLTLTRSMRWESFRCQTTNVFNEGIPIKSMLIMGITVISYIR